METSPRQKAAESIADRTDPFEPIRGLVAHEAEPGVENDRLVMAEKQRIEASKQATNKPEQITPDFSLHSQDSAA